LTVIKVWSWAPDGCLMPRQAGRLTVGRNVTLTLSLTSAVPNKESSRWELNAVTVLVQWWVNNSCSRSRWTSQRIGIRRIEENKRPDCEELTCD
jgi:hypothetical protein